MTGFENLYEHMASNYMLKYDDIYRTTTENIDFALNNSKIYLTEDNTFFVRCDFEYAISNQSELRARDIEKQVLTKEHLIGKKCHAYNGIIDHGHTSPDWEKIFKLGLRGLFENAKEHLRNTKDSKKIKFYTMVVEAYKSAFVFLNRCAEFAAEAGKEKMAKGISNLINNPPSDMFEAFQLTLIYYNLQHNLEGAYLRTMGNLDRLLLPFAHTEENIPALCEAYFREINSYKFTANIPFAIAGTDMEGKDLTNVMSHYLLDAYVKLKPSMVKIHILYSDVTDVTLINKALDSIRTGGNSIVFMGDKTVKKSLEKLGMDKEDTSNYAVVGCYETIAKDEVGATCSTTVNIVKALELALNNGYDMITGDAIGITDLAPAKNMSELKNAFYKQLEYLCSKAIEMTNLLEENYGKIIAVPFYSSAMSNAMEKGRDIYADYGAKYNNCSLNAIGLATVVDSLMSIEYLLSDEIKLNIDNVRDILLNNWQNAEILRLKVKKNSPKYGNGNKTADLCAAEIVNFLSERVNGVPNSRGGFYRLGTFSIDWRIEYGAHTGASADGRYKGEALSQNTTASFGADKNGVTSHILSVCTPDHTDTANGSVLDLDLHQSAVRGDEGLAAFKGIIDTYVNNGGFAIHCNVLSADALKKAQKNPELYPNLQIRLCGWNVLFSELNKSVQDEFIFRADNLN